MGGGFTVKVITSICVIAVIMTGCSTCPPCVPTTEVQEVITPVYSCPEPPDTPPVVLPPWPMLPPNATDTQMKQWYLEMARTFKARQMILTEHVESLNEMLNAYRGN